MRNSDRLVIQLASMDGRFPLKLLVHAETSSLAEFSSDFLFLNSVHLFCIIHKLVFQNIEHNKKESHVSTRLGTDHHQLIMPPISKDCSNTFLERSFIYAAPCEWNRLSEHIRTSNFDCFRKSVITMLFTQQYGC